MSNKFSNKTMLLVFVALGVLFVVTRFTPVKKGRQTLNTQIVQIDTAKISSFTLSPGSEEGASIEFKKDGSSWWVMKDGIRAPAENQSVKNILTELRNLKTDQLVTKSEKAWDEYQVTDSLGSRIVIREGKKTSLDLVVGRFHYQPPDQNSYQMYGQNRVSGKTYIRVTGEPEVYAVEGFLAMSINQPFDRWRNQAVTRFNSSQLTRIIYDYPADSGFVAEKSEAGWMVAGLLADSASVASYINKISHKSHSEFLDGTQPRSRPDYTVSFEGDNMAPQQVRVYDRGTDTMVLNSSINPESWFTVTREGLFNDLFPAMSVLQTGSGSGSG